MKSLSPTHHSSEHRAEHLEGLKVTKTLICFSELFHIWTQEETIQRQVSSETQCCFRPTGRCYIRGSSEIAM